MKCLVEKCNNPAAPDDSWCEQCGDKLTNVMIDANLAVMEIMDELDRDKIQFDLCAVNHAVVDFLKEKVESVPGQNEKVYKATMKFLNSFMKNRSLSEIVYICGDILNSRSTNNVYSQIDCRPQLKLVGSNE